MLREQGATEDDNEWNTTLGNPQEDDLGVGDIINTKLLVKCALEEEHQQPTRHSLWICHSVPALQLCSKRSKGSDS